MYQHKQKENKLKNFEARFVVGLYFEVSNDSAKSKQSY